MRMSSFPSSGYDRLKALLKQPLIMGSWNPRDSGLRAGIGIKYFVIGLGSVLRSTPRS